MSAREVVGAADILPYAELTDIRVYEVAARRLPSGDGQEPVEDFGVLANGAEDHLETRARLYMRTAEAELVVEVGSVYTFSEPLRITQSAAREFVERVGMMAVYPFVREQVFSAARRLGVAAPVLGLPRQGQFSIVSNEDPQEGAGDATS